jgi:hypothetical protein
MKLRFLKSGSAPICFFLSFTLSLNGVQLDNTFASIPLFAEMDRDAINRMEDTALISGNGQRIVYVDNCLHGTSLSALLSHDIDPANIGGIKTYDVGSGTLRTIFEGGWGNRTGGGVSTMDAFISADITDDGNTVVAAIARISLSESGGDVDRIHRIVKIVRLDAVSGDMTEITQLAGSGNGDRVEIRISGNGSRALVAVHPPDGGTTSTWGVEYDTYYDKYELYAIELQVGSTPVRLTDPLDDYSIGQYRGVRYGFSISDNGSRIAYTQVDSSTNLARVVTANFDGSNATVVASGLQNGFHTTLSGDGSTVAYVDWNSSAYTDDEIYINAFGGGAERLLLDDWSSQFGMLYLNTDGSALTFANGIGGDAWYFGAALLHIGEAVTRISLGNKGVLSGSNDLSRVLHQNDDSPLYLSDVTGLPGGGGGGGSGVTGIDFLDAAAEVGEGWRYSPWFGYVKTDTFPWVYHLEHKWIYFNDEGSANGVIYRDVCLLWVYTSEDLYPWMYSYYDGDWNYFYRGSTSPNRFWYSYLLDFDFEEWVWDE